MKTKNDGGPAFPGFSYTEGRGNAKSVQGPNGIEWEYYAPGMSLRDWFAGMAITGLAAEDERTQSQPNYELWAENSYKLADAMLVEREKGE
jgi:hypothetical protein